MNADAIEAVSVKDLLKRLTGAPYRVSEPPKGFTSKPKWFIWCPDSYFIDKTGHLWAVWLDDQNEVRFESSDFDNTTELVLSKYGEEGAGKAMDIDYSDKPEEMVRSKLAVEFPMVGQVLHGYDRIIAEESAKTGVKLRLLFESGDGMAWFKLGASMPAGSDWKSNKKAIQSAAGAMKKAYDLLCKAQT